MKPINCLNISIHLYLVDHTLSDIQHFLDRLMCVSCVSLCVGGGGGWGIMFMLKVLITYEDNTELYEPCTSNSMSVIRVYSLWCM